MQPPVENINPDSWAVISSIATAIAAFFAAVAALISYLHGRAAQKGQKASISFEISQRYNSVYEKMNELDKNPVRWQAFDKAYPSEDDKRGSAEWKLLREVGGFFELVGSMVDEKIIDHRLLFKFMNIRPQLWYENRETILGVRGKHNHQELWIYWEKLVEKYVDYNKAHPDNISLAAQASSAEISPQNTPRTNSGSITEAVGEQPVSATPEQPRNK